MERSETESESGVGVVDGESGRVGERVESKVGE
jgi:hypothetical protein